MNKFRQAYKKIIMFRGTMCGFVKKLFGISPNSVDGVCWYLDWYKTYNMDQMGLERITRELISDSEAGNISKISVDKTKSDASPEKLAIMSVQFYAVTYAGRPFCVDKYLTEGDDPMLFGV